MAATLKNPYILRGSTHVSDYHKSLSSTYSKKRLWKYLSEQRALFFRKMMKQSPNRVRD